VQPQLRRNLLRAGGNRREQDHHRKNLSSRQVSVLPQSKATWSARREAAIPDKVIASS
jgi:hypothetical protein